MDHADNGYKSSVVQGQDGAKGERGEDGEQGESVSQNTQIMQIEKDECLQKPSGWFLLFLPSTAGLAWTSWGERTSRTPRKEGKFMLKEVTCKSYMCLLCNYTLIWSSLTGKIGTDTIFCQSCIYL